MELFTSRWANRALARVRCVPVGISRGNPRWRTGYRYRKLWSLAPSRSPFGIEDPAAAEESYRAGLDELGVERIESELRRISSEHGGLPLVLLCHEDVHAGQDCHRRWFAWWFEQQTGTPVPELEVGMLEEASEVDQQRLF